MKKRPIQMSGLNVARTIAGLKCETRRLAGLEALNGTKKDPGRPDHFQFVRSRKVDTLGRMRMLLRLLPDMVIADAKKISDLSRDDHEVTVTCPYGDLGDHLWFRETTAKALSGFVYRADAPNAKTKPRELVEDANWCEVQCRNRWTPAIHMPKVAARVEVQVMDIGLERLWDITTAGAKREGCRDLHEFANLWLSLNGQASWDLNPWVWVVLYEKRRP